MLKAEGNVTKRPSGKHWKWQICGVLSGFFSHFKTVFKSYLLYNPATKRHLLSKNKNIYPPKDLYLNVHSSFFIFALSITGKNSNVLQQVN